MRHLAPYFPLAGTADGALSTSNAAAAAAVASAAALYQPQASKAPWWAAWDRTLRAVLHWERVGGASSGAAAAGGPLGLLFASHVEAQVEGGRAGGRMSANRLLSVSVRHAGAVCAL